MGVTRMMGSDDLTPWVGKWVKVEGYSISTEGWLRAGCIFGPRVRIDHDSDFHIATGQVNDGQDLAIFTDDTITLVREIW